MTPPSQLAAQPRSPSQSGAVFLVMGSCLSLQLGAALATYLFPYAGPWAVTTLRLLIAGLILSIFVRPRIRQWTKQQWRYVILFGLSLGGMNGFFYASIESIPLGTAVTIEFLGPLLLAALLSRSARDLLWVAVALIGMALIGFDSLIGTTLDPLGLSFALIAGGFWMAYILISKKVGQLVPGQGGLALAFVIGSIFLLPLGTSGIHTIIVDPQLVLLALLTALLGSLIPYSLELAALRRLPARVFGILLSLEPVFAAAVGWVLLAQYPSPLKWAAIILVTIASIGVSFDPKKALLDAKTTTSSASVAPKLRSKLASLRAKSPSENSSNQ